MSTSRDLPNSARIVIVGGGVAGCSIAYHLAQMGEGCENEPGRPGKHGRVRGEMMSLRPGRVATRPRLFVAKAAAAPAGAARRQFGRRAPAGPSAEPGILRRLVSRRQADELTVTQDGDAPDCDSARSVSPAVIGTFTGAGASESGGATLDRETRLGRFVLLRLLGEGGMGVVYTAWDELLDRRVALKLLRADHDGDAQARMLHEAKGLARLSHPNVVQIYEVSISAGRLFIAMEYIPGSTLRAWTTEKRLAGSGLREIIDMYIQAGRGLAAAHARGLVHRDFKPDNVLVGEDGRARVVDFGLVTTRDSPTRRAPVRDPEDARPPVEGARLTVDGMLLGTPAYMPPEQLAGRPADARSDQFSFCAALHEALCGMRPFAGDRISELRVTVPAGAFRNPPVGDPIPTWLTEILRRGLAPRPEDRFPTMDALLAQLADDPARRRRRRRRAAALVICGAVIAVLLVFLAVELRQRWLHHQRERNAELARRSAEVRIDEARGAADKLAAQEAFAAFITDPAHDGTAALARAWLDEAGRRRTDGALDEARDDFATAYANAPTPPLQIEALRGLADVFRRRLEWDALANLLALFDREHPEAVGALADLRIDAAFAHRDLASARDLLADAPGELQGLSQAQVSATATDHRHIVEVRVGEGHLSMLERHMDTPTVHIVRADPSLSTELEFPAPPGTTIFLLLAGEPLTFVGHEPVGEYNTVYRVEPGRVTPVHRWQGPRIFAGAAADLDGDGARELYLGTGTGLDLIELITEPDGRHTTRVVYTTTDTLDSTAHGLAAVDLDGDGREELAASFTGWRAYDVRVLARAPDGTLRTVARDKLGTVLGVTPLSSVDGSTRLVAKNLHLDTSTLVFPPDRPSGEPEGLYSYELADHRLVRRDYLPLGLPPDAAAYGHWAPDVGDANGDGRDDIAVAFDRPGAAHTRLFLQTEDGSFTPTVLGHTRFLGFAQLDTDPAHEMVASIPDEAGGHRVWVLGAGRETLPPIATAPAPTPASIDAADPAWTRQWRQAEALRDLGLHAPAAAAFERLARRSPDPRLRAEASLVAGRLRERVDEHRPALALLHAATEAPALAAVALREALPIELRVGDYEAARTSLRGLKTLLAGEDDELDRLAAVINRASDERLELRFDGPLDPRWRIEDPLGLRREPGGDGLELATNSAGALASLPVYWSGDLIELEVDFTTLESECGTGLDVYLVPEDEPEGPQLVGIHVILSGTRRGGMTVMREYNCAVAGHALHGTPHPGISQRASDTVRLTMRASAIPALGEIGCDRFEPTHAATSSYHEELTRPLPPAGRYRLVIRPISHYPAWLRARLHRITVRGVQLVEDPASDRAELHRAIVEADPHTTLAALAELPAASPREQVWRAHALLRVGRGAEARALLTSLLAVPGPPPPALLLLLRADPRLVGPVLAELLGERHLELVREVWRSTAVNHLDGAPGRHALRAVLATLDADALLATSDLGALGRACELLRWRADIHARDGESTRARTDLERVLRATERLPVDSPQYTGRWSAYLELASLAARDGHPASAREAIRAAFASTSMPLLVGDIVRARSELAALWP